MQEIHHDHSMTAERKVPRPNHHQILKCPRCESLNTKFCYYNNYNLSQPRHFCKGCRRYWTKGGLLRNITVGSGSRKPKRSNSNNNNKNNTAPSTQPPPAPPPEPPSSSGGSSTLTEATSRMFAADQGGGVFNEAAESFTTSSMSSTNEAIDQAFGFGNSGSNIISDTSSFWDGEFGSLDWNGSGGDDQGLIDLSNYSVDDDDQLYWTHTHWSHQDNPALFHLP